MRAEIVLLAADGMTNLAIAERWGITRVTVATWRGRFAAGRLDGLVDEPRPGAPRKIGDEKIAEVVTTTLETMPAAATLAATASPFFTPRETQGIFGTGKPSVST